MSSSAAPGVPYAVHPMEVAQILSKAGHGDDLLLLLRALFHDATEDAKDPAEARIFLEAQYGQDLVLIVEELTSPDLPTAERKQHQIDHAPTMSDRARMIKLADQISNLSSETPSHWSPEKAQSDRALAIKVARAHTGISAGLDCLLEATIYE